MNTNNPNPKTTAMNNEYYDLQHLKAIPIADYLHTTYGIEPAKRYNGYALYHAPYREDFNASMKVDFRENLWHDYATGQFSGRRGFCSKGGLDDNAKERNFNNGIIGYSKRLEL